MFFNLQNYITFKEGLGSGSNNFVERNALKLLMTKTLEWGVRNLQIFGDSKIIINWANGFQRCHIIRLISLLEEILVLKQNFDFLSITHVYRERNRVADKLSKEGTQLQEGQGISETFLRDSGCFYHIPFHEAAIRIL